MRGCAPGLFNHYSSLLNLGGHAQDRTDVSKSMEAEDEANPRSLFVQVVDAAADAVYPPLKVRDFLHLGLHKREQVRMQSQRSLALHQALKPASLVPTTHVYMWRLAVKGMTVRVEAHDAAPSWMPPTLCGQSVFDYHKGM